ncbi:MAG: response regulator [Planctomycetota bacterium]|jgi:DNA-binding response OmpR family regulator
MIKNGIAPEARAALAPVVVPHVLVVDDKESFARRLAREFKGEGFEATAVFDGSEALAALGTFRPDLVVLDAGMENGLECLRRLHARCAPETPPVLLLTGDPDPQVDAAALVYPGSVVLRRPRDYLAVVRAAERMLAIA